MSSFRLFFSHSKLFNLPLLPPNSFITYKTSFFMTKNFSISRIPLKIFVIASSNYILLGILWFLIFCWFSFVFTKWLIKFVLSEEFFLEKNLFRIELLFSSGLSFFTGLTVLLLLIILLLFCYFIGIFF